MRTERGGQHAHNWREDVCADCDLRRRETWTLDPDGNAVMTLVWSSPGGRVLRVRPFPVLLGVAPMTAPTQSVDEAFPGVRVAKEPKCPHGPTDWDADAEVAEA